MFDEVCTGNLLRAEPADMGGKLLAIYKTKIPGLELSDKSNERDL